MYRVGDVCVMMIEGKVICELTVVKVLKTGLRMKFQDDSVGFIPYKMISGSAGE